MSVTINYPKSPLIGKVISFKTTGFAPHLSGLQTESLLELLGKALIPDPETRSEMVRRCFVSGTLNGKVVGVFEADGELCYRLRIRHGREIVVPAEEYRR